VLVNQSTVLQVPSRWSLSSDAAISTPQGHVGGIVCVAIAVRQNKHLCHFDGYDRLSSVFRFLFLAYTDVFQIVVPIRCQKCVAGLQWWTSITNE